MNIGLLTLVERMRDCLWPSTVLQLDYDTSN